MKYLKKIPLFLLITLALAGGGGTYYFYTQYQTMQTKLNNPEQTAQEEVSALVAELSSFMELPTDEQPNVATVLDKDKLQDQSFFAKAENGDKVIIYSKAGKAILYRESTGKIIEVAPIQITPPSPESSSPEPSPTPKPTPKPTPEPSPSEPSN